VDVIGRDPPTQPVESTSVLVCIAESFCSPSSGLVIDVASLGGAFRVAFFACFFAPTGNLFFPPQVVHSSTTTSAQGFLPPLLIFSTVCVAVRPGTRTVLQRLHMVRFRSTDSRSWALRETCWRSEQSRTARGETVWEPRLCGGASTSFALASIKAPFDAVCRVRYVAAWYRNVVRAWRCLLGTPLDFGSLTLLIVVAGLKRFADNEVHPGTDLNSQSASSCRRMACLINM
jgi:hypothetical protein